MINLTRPDGTPIESWKDWTRPKRDYQWKSRRSAMELAKAWFRDDRRSPPSEFMDLMASEVRLKKLDLLRGIPELVTALPERGEGRNHDLVLVAQTPREQVTICVEAKADEPFGTEIVLEYWKRALDRRGSGESTRVPERIQALLEMVGQSGSVSAASPWSSVRYQLLSAICGTARQAQADSSTLAVLVVHEFRTGLTDQENLSRNHSHLEKFMSVLSSDEITVEPGRLYGPFKVNGVDCLVGKAVAESKTDSSTNR